MLDQYRDPSIISDFKCLRFNNDKGCMYSDMNNPNRYADAISMEQPSNAYQLQLHKICSSMSPSLG